jgi:hypothetical protein
MRYRTFSSKVLLALTMLGMVFTASGKPVYAQAWGEAISATFLKQALEQVQKGIEGTVLGAVKTAAVTAIANQVDRLIGGVGGGGPLIIRNYDDYLREQPLQQARINVYNFLTRTYRGVSSSSNYIGTDGTSAVKGNYAGYLQSRALRSATNQMQTDEKYTFNDLCSSVDKLKEGDLRCLRAYVASPANNPFGAEILAERQYRDAYNELRYQRQIELTSSGFVGRRDSRGNVVVPSSSVEALYNDSKTLANRILAAAQNPQELISGVITAVINRSINALAYKAAGAVEDVINNTVGKAVDQINHIAGDVGRYIRTADGYVLTVDGYLTEAGFQADQLNQLKRDANTQTPPPPSPLPPIY